MPLSILLKPKVLRVTITGNGSGSVNFTPPATYKWNVTQIGLSCPSVALSKAAVFLDNNFYCGTNSGNQDAADGTPLAVKDGSVLTITWSGATAGTVAVASLLVEEVASNDNSVGF